eukprot:352200_1
MADRSSKDSSSNGDTTDISHWKNAWTMTSNQSELSTSTSKDSFIHSGSDSDISSNCYIAPHMKQEPSEDSITLEQIYTLVPGYIRESHSACRTEIIAITMSYCTSDSGVYLFSSSLKTSAMITYSEGRISVNNMNIIIYLEDFIGKSKCLTFNKQNFKDKVKSVHGIGEQTANLLYRYFELPFQSEKKKRALIKRIINFFVWKSYNRYG